MSVRRAAAAVLIPAAWCACAVRRPAPPPPRADMIRGVQQEVRRLGVPETGNFERKGKREAYFRCYYTGKLELPDSYEGLQMKDGSAAGCGVDEERYDVFFYRIEALAGTKTPVTQAFQETSEERAAFVVAHEDLHEDRALERLPVRVNEAAATLLGFLAAARYARNQRGAGSELYRNLAREPGLYLKKARLVNRGHRLLQELYRRFDRGLLSRSEALAEKERLFAEMREACQREEPEPTSFNKCLTANNNAGLAFEITYTRWYPLLYEVHQALGGDLEATIRALRRAAGVRGEGEEPVKEALERIARGCRPERDVTGGDHCGAER